MPENSSVQEHSRLLVRSNVHADSIQCMARENPRNHAWPPASWEPTRKLNTQYFGALKQTSNVHTAIARRASHAECSHTPQLDAAYTTDFVAVSSNIDTDGGLGNRRVARGEKINFRKVARFLIPRVSAASAYERQAQARDSRETRIARSESSRILRGGRRLRTPRSAHRGGNRSA